MHTFNNLRVWTSANTCDIITPINNRHTHHLPEFPCVPFVCVVRTLTVRSTLLTNLFWSAQSWIVNYRHFVLEQISRIYSSSKTETLYPLNNNSSFPSPSRSWQPLLYHLFLWVWLFSISGIMQHLSCDWLIHLPKYLPGPSMLLQVAGFLSFLRLNNIP